MGLPLSLGASQVSVSPSSSILGASGTPTDVRRAEGRGKGRMGEDEKRGVVERRGEGGTNEGE